MFSFARVGQRDDMVGEGVVPPEVSVDPVWRLACGVSFQSQVSPASSNHIVPVQADHQLVPSCEHGSGRAQANTGAETNMQQK